MDGFDPLTCGAPSRSRVDEDDEAEAEAAAQAHPPAPPLLTLTPSARAAFADDKARTPLLVLAFGPVASALLHHVPGAEARLVAACGAQIHSPLTRNARSATQLCGSLVLPEASLAGGALQPSPRDAGVCHLFSAPGGAVLAAAGGGDAGGVPAERAAAWTAALFEQLQPRRVVALAPLPPGSPAMPRAAPLAALQTAAAASSLPPPAAPLLPPGPLLGGAPAAVMTHCQVAGVAARCYAHDALARAPPAELLAAALAVAVEAEVAAAGIAPLGLASAAAAARAAGHLRGGGSSLYT